VGHAGGLSRDRWQPLEALLTSAFSLIAQSPVFVNINTYFAFLFKLRRVLYAGSVAHPQISRFKQQPSTVLPLTAQSAARMQANFRASRVIAPTQE
jgi:hypothetical protein